MANHCWNLFSFYGNERVLEQVKQWQDQLNQIKPTEDDKFCMRAIRQVFYPNAKADERLDYGSKWVHQDTDAISSAEYQLGFQSAWSSPDKLQKHLTLILRELDNFVLVENFYWIENDAEGYVYTAVNSEEAICIQTAYVECPYDEFDDREEAESHMEELLTEYQHDALSDLLFEVPAIARVVKNHFPKLDIDWSQYD